MASAALDAAAAVATAVALIAAPAFHGDKILRREAKKIIEADKARVVVRRKRKGKPKKATFGAKRSKATGKGVALRPTMLQNPQFLSIRTPIHVLVDRYTVEKITTNVGASGGNFLVMEVLWVDFYWGYLDALIRGLVIHSVGLAATPVRVFGDTCTGITALEDTHHASNIANITSRLENFVGITTAGTPAAGVEHVLYQRDVMPKRINLQDNRGNGLLVASPFLYFYSGAFGNSLIGASSMRMSYRMKVVTASDFYRIKANL